MKKQHKESKESVSGKKTDCCPVIEGGGIAALSHVRRILVPADLSEDSDSAVRCAVRLAKEYDASINATYGFASLNDLQKEAADLIVISARKPSSQRLDEIVRHAPCPVVVVCKDKALLRSRPAD